MAARPRSLKKVVSEVWIKREAHEEYYFVLSNYKKLKNLNELTQEIFKMPDEIFKNHLNLIKNDFMTLDVFKENFLAELKTNNKIEAELNLQIHINKKLNGIIKRLVKK